MAVRPSRHRTGIGTALLARAFYEARGFVAIEEFIDFWDDEPMLLMVKAL